MKNQDKFALALTVLGEKQLPSKSGKYRTFSRKDGGFYFLGRSGALRIGRASSRSVPAAESLKAKLISLADQQHHRGTVTLEDI